MAILNVYYTHLGDHKNVLYINQCNVFYLAVKIVMFYQKLIKLEHLNLKINFNLICVNIDMIKMLTYSYFIFHLDKNFMISNS